MRARASLCGSAALKCSAFCSNCLAKLARSPFAALSWLSIAAIWSGFRSGFAFSFSIVSIFFLASSTEHWIALSAASAAMGLVPATWAACSNAVRASAGLPASNSATPWW